MTTHNLGSSIRNAVFTLCVFSLAACDARNAFDVQGPDGTKIDLEAGFAINDGESYPLTVTVRDAMGNPMEANIAWQTSNPEIVSVSSAGVVTGERPGQATIVASANSVTASSQVTVRSVPTELEYVAGSGQQGQEFQPLDEELTVRVVDRRGNPVAGVRVDFEVMSGGGSAAPSNTTTNADGYAETVWTVGSSGEQTIASIAEPPAHVEEIPDSMVVFSAVALEATTPQPTPGEPSGVTDLRVTGTGEESVTLRWTAVPDGAGGSASYAVRYGSPTLQWSTAYPTEQTIAAATNGAAVTHTVTGLEAGTDYQFRLVSYRGTLNQNAVFGPYSNTVSASTDEADAPPPTIASVTATPASHTFTELNATRQVNAVARDAAGNVMSGTQFSWSSSSNSVVTVSGSGLMTARGEGAARVIVSAGGFADTVNVAVEIEDEPPPPTIASVTATPASHTFTELNATRQVNAVARDAAGAVMSGTQFSWSSSRTSVATVSGSGLMTARGEGTARVIVSAGGFADTVNVTVEIEDEPPPPPAVASVTVSPSSHTFTALGETRQASATARDASGNVVSGAELTWSSTNSSVVSVDNMGRMTARAVGSALVIVSSVCCTASDTIDAQVRNDEPPPTGSGDYPNRPSGLTLIGSMDGSVKESGGSAFGISSFGGWSSRGARNINVVNDATNPTGSGRSVRFTWDATDDGAGVATANTFSGGPYRELYIMTRIFMEEGGWNFGHKFFYIGAHTNSRAQSGPTSYYVDRPSGGSSQRIRFLTQNNGSQSLVNSSDAPPKGTNSSPLVLGRWLNIEYRLVAESSSGAGDGECYIWVNGTLVGYNTNIAWNPAGAPTPGFNGMEWYATANNVVTTSYYRLGELYIAGRK